MISKKDLLTQTGISYGQFYRWKRMGLIPESWFERRSTFTGQETFLPREKVLERIEQIQALKDRYELEEIADMLVPGLGRAAYAASEVLGLKWVSEQARELFRESVGEKEEFEFRDMVALGAIDECLKQGKLSRDQIGLLAQAVILRLDEISRQSEAYFAGVVSRFGVSMALLFTGVCLPGPQAEVVAVVDLLRVVERVNIELHNLRDTGGDR